MIPNIKLNNNLEMPMVGIGTWQLKGEKCIESVKKSLQLGYRHIDTAEMYINESEIGQAIKGINREELFITSKVSPDNLDYYKVLAACEESLARLETHYIDLYLIHWPTNTMDLRESLRAFKKLIDEGKIKSFGVSNFTINHLKDTMRFADEIGLKVSNNQVEFHPFLYQKELLEFCKQNNITLTSYSPLAQGEIFDNQIMKEIANKYDKNPGQISLRWLLDKGTIVIPKSSSELHLKENLDLDFELSQEDTEKIDHIDRRLRIVNPSFADFEY